MARHSRNLVNENNPYGGLRTLIRFIRTDLLVKAEVRDPYDDTMHFFPIEIENRFIGPNVHDVVIRRPPTITEIKEAKKKEKVLSDYIWILRPLRSLFIDIEKRKTADGEEKLRPYNSRFVTGGKNAFHETEDYVTVSKNTSVSISTLAYQLCIAMDGGVENARNRVDDLASRAWRNDTERARKIYELIKESDEEYLNDSEIPSNLKEATSISQFVESSILKSACLWFGVDPEKEIPKQKRGKRAKRKQQGYRTDEDIRIEYEEETYEAEVIQMTLRGEAISAFLIQEYNEIPKGTDLASLGLLSIVEMLGTLIEDGYEEDKELLEEYLDQTWPSWRDRIGDEATEKSIDSFDPWEVLGVKKGASKSDIKRAYHKAMLTVHPDKSGLPSFFSILASNAYKQLISEVS